MIRRFMAIAAVAVCMTGPAMAELDDNGLHVAPWLHETFKDLREDLAEATANGQRFAVIIEQRGCIYCREMHEEVFVDPEILEMLNDDYFFVRLDMYGGTEVTDFDGETMRESEVVRRWRTLFTPTILFFPEEVPEGMTGLEAAVATMPGAFSRGMTRNMMTWVLGEGYNSDESFQAYHARILRESGVISE
ncbi:thioredoxin family protein [Roseibacterium sp. SDUM158016]|uniref:thioredoxin family protein n=1 Tax=Roseicyclus sediminis TaxID=2980997 RepID=UPI0021D05C3C|nr:thioredoxin family protein [Roseibacterium sp. SDUM158016]MCU4651414.1 thioredoxin family protein [Roseibacterium sp. SDUM158016]